MPEGDTIHELAGVLREELVGRAARELRVEHQPVTSAAGRTVDEVFAVGKHLFVSFGDHALRTHLGMRGTWHRYAPGERWERSPLTASAVLRVPGRDYVCFRARESEWVDLAGDRHRSLMRRLGPDLLSDDFDLEAAVRRARTSLPPTTILADVLLDQRTVAGIGNVYKSELLFLEALHPAAALSSVSDEQLAALFERARASLQENLRPGPRRTRGARPRRAGAPGGSDDPRHWVYRRGGAPCLVCDTTIETASMGRHGRGTWWCPRCQTSCVSSPW